MHKGITSAAIAATICVLLFGCATEQSRKADYKRAVTLPPLEVPPALTAPENQGTLEIPQSYLAHMAQGGAKGPQVLIPQRNVRVLRDGTMYWLQIDATPEQLWDNLHKFWQEQGLEVQRDQPQLGIMETQWAENRADVARDWLQGMVSKVFENAYSAPTRDKFRLRVERSGDGAGTEVFISHYGIEEVQRGQSVEYYDTIWQMRPANPELVVEMLNRMMVFFGTPQTVADSQVAGATTPPARVVLEDGGKAARLNENFARSWRRVGIALDRLGLVVEDRNRSAGLYYIRAVDALEDAGVAKKGFFSGMFSDDDAASASAPARIHLQDSGATTRVTVQDKDGQQDTSAAALKILQQLEAELR